MDIDFPLILVILVLVTGVIWALDKLVLAKSREADDPVPAWVEYSGSFFPVLFIVLVLRSFLFEPFQIPSASMVPTLRIGDFILVNKYAYGLRLPVLGTKIVEIGEPQRGDVMVFFPPNDERYFIKRVIGLPGDKIQLIDNILYINGEQMKQHQLDRTLGEDPRYVQMSESLSGVDHIIRKARVAGRYGRNYSITVPEGHYFMMGDNRDNSSDSRAWGTVPEKNIVGKAVAVWMHWDAFFSLPGFDRVGKIQ